MNEKGVFNKDGELDTGVVRIMDLAHWNPKNGAALSKKEKEVDTKEEGALQPKTVADKSKLSAPHVIDREGNIVLDEKSLFVRGTHLDIDEDQCGRKFASNLLKKNMSRKGVTWSPKETNLFYEILRCTGPDFGIMSEFYPSRTRLEMKAKYNREVKHNWQRIELTMKNPLALDNSLKDRADRLAQEIKNEAQAKMDKTNKKKARTKTDAENRDDQEFPIQIASYGKKTFPRNARRTVPIKDEEEDSENEPFVELKKARKTIAVEQKVENKKKEIKIETSADQDIFEPEQKA